jgi:hypothetical protein
LNTEVEQKEKHRIEWRRGKVQELSSQGYSQRDIAQVLQVSNGSVNRPLAKETLKLDLLTNATVVDAIRFASNHQAKVEVEGNS